MTTYRLTDLDRKVAFVVGHCEFHRIRQILIQKDVRDREPSHKRILDCTKQRAIAEQLCISPPQWSRMKKGREAISDVHLARLSEYFDVDRSCDFLVWTRPYDVFINTLTTLGYGRLRYRATGPGLADVLDSLTRESGDGLRIIVVARAACTTRGIGSPIDDTYLLAELRVGDRVRIAIAGSVGLPHLVLLSLDPDGCFTVLAPAQPGVSSGASNAEMLLPDETGSYLVGRPFGLHRLYAILAASSLGLENHLDFATLFPPLSGSNESFLRDVIVGRSDRDVQVLRLNYDVIR